MTDALPPVSAIAEIDEIRACEERLRQAMLASDSAALDGLIDDALVFTAPGGERLTKSQDLAAHRSGQLKLTRLDLSETRFHPMADGVAVTTQARLAGSFGGTAFSGDFAYTRLWTPSPQGWRVAFGHCSPLAATA